MGSGRGGLVKVYRWLIAGGEDETRSENKRKYGKVKIEVVVKQWVDSRRPKSDALSDF